MTPLTTSEPGAAGIACAPAGPSGKHDEGTGDCLDYGQPVSSFQPQPDYPISARFRLRQLASEYARLRQLDGYDVASRGRRFNSWLAEMLQAWGHRARADENEHGNIDVAFAVRDTRFVLEAKWERDRTPIDPITKLQKRVAQRLGGTIGVFVSMAGYTQPALADLKDGQRLEVLLLTSEHVEAMLTGFCPPEELFELMLDHAHFYGVPTRPLSELLADDRQRGLPVIGDRELGPPAATMVGAGVTASWLADGNIPFGQSGLSVFADGRLVAVTGRGLLLIDPESRTCEWLHAPTHVTDAKALPTGDIAIVRRFGVARLKDGVLRIVDGPFSGRVRFTIDCFATEEIAVWSNDARGTGGIDLQRGAIAHLGAEPGDARVVEVKDAGTGGATAARLSSGVTLVLGNPTVLIDGERAHIVDVPTSNPFTAAPIGDELLIVGGEIDVLRADAHCQGMRKIAVLNMRGSVVDMAVQRDRPNVVYVMAGDRRSEFMSIARVEIADDVPV